MWVVHASNFFIGFWKEKLDLLSFLKEEFKLVQFLLKDYFLSTSLDNCIINSSSCITFSSFFSFMFFNFFCFHFVFVFIFLDEWHYFIGEVIMTKFMIILSWLYQVKIYPTIIGNKISPWYLPKEKGIFNCWLAIIPLSSLIHSNL